MTIILRLQGLPWSASSMDIREFFAGMSIPDGGVHIVGGETGDVFIAFSTDEDARKAMQKQSQPLCGSRVSILLSSKSEMQEVIAKSRSTTVGRREPFSPSSSQQLTSTQSPTSPISHEGSQVTSSSTSSFRTSTDVPSTVTTNRNDTKVSADDPAIFGGYLTSDRYSNYGYAYGKPSERSVIGNFQERPTDTSAGKSLNIGAQSVNIYGPTSADPLSKSFVGRSSHPSEQWASEQDLYNYQRYEKDLRQERDQTYGHTDRPPHEGPLSNPLEKLTEGTSARGVDQFHGTYSDSLYSSSYRRDDDKQQASQKVDPAFELRGDTHAPKNYNTPLVPGSERKSSTHVDLNNQRNNQRDQQKSIPPIPDNLVERLRDVFPLTGLGKLGSGIMGEKPKTSDTQSLVAAPSQSFQGTNPNVSYSVTGFNTSTISRQKSASDEHQQNIPYRSQKDSVNLVSSVSSSSMKSPDYSQYTNTSQKLFPSASESSLHQFDSTSRRPYSSYELQQSRLEGNFKPRSVSFPYDSRKDHQHTSSKFGGTDMIVHERDKQMEIHDASPQGMDDDYYEDPAFPGKPLGLEEAASSQGKDSLLIDPYKQPSKAPFDEPRENQFGRKLPPHLDRPPGRTRVSRFDESYGRTAHKSPDTFEKPFGKNIPGHREDSREKQFGVAQSDPKLGNPDGALRQRYDEPFNKSREPSYEKSFGREPVRGPEEPFLRPHTNPELGLRPERHANKVTGTPKDEEYGRRPVPEGPVGRFRDRDIPFEESHGDSRYDREGISSRSPQRPEFPSNAPLLGQTPAENMEKSLGRFSQNEIRGRHFGEPYRERPVVDTQEDVVVLDNLPIDCEEGNVLSFFHGLNIAPDGIRMQIDTITRRNTGRALVQFVSSLDASDALKRSHQTMKGRPITITKCPLDEWSAATGGKVNIEPEEERLGLDAKDKPLGTMESALESPHSRPLLPKESHRQFLGRGPMPLPTRGPRPLLEKAPRPSMERGPRLRFDSEMRQLGELGPRSHLRGQLQPLDEEPRGGRFPVPPLRASILDHDSRDSAVRPPFPPRERSPFRDSRICIELRGLPFDAETKDIVDFFDGIQIARGSVFVERTVDGKVLGKCYLELEDSRQVDLALLQHGKMMGKRSVDVSQVPYAVMLQRISEAEKRMADRRASMREESKPSELARDGKSSRDRSERSRSSRDRDRDRMRERDRSRDSNRERERERDRGRDRDRERDKERRDKDRSRDRDRSKERDRPRERDRTDEKDRKDDKEKKKETDKKGDDKTKSSREPKQPDKVNQPPVPKEIVGEVQPKQIQPPPLMPTVDKGSESTVGKKDSQVSIPSLLAPINPKISLPLPLPLPTSGKSVSSEPLKPKPPTVGLLPEPDIPLEHKTTGYISVRNVPYVSTENDILQFFAGLKVIPGGIHMMRHADGKFNGQAFIEFADPSEAERAMERRHMVMRDRIIQISLTTKAAMMQAIRSPAPPSFNPTVNKPGPFLPPTRFDGGSPRPRLVRPGLRMGVPPAGGGRGSAIFVGNLNETVSVPILGNLFAEYAVVPGGIRIGVDPTGRPLGEAKVAFPSRDEAIRAVRELNGVMFAGRRLQLNVIS